MATQVDLFGVEAPYRADPPHRPTRRAPEPVTDPVIALLSAPRAGQLAALDPAGQVPVRCRHCDRPLRTVESRAVGIGPVCAARERAPADTLL